MENTNNIKDGCILCPECKSKLSDYHVVQCENCQSIVGFLVPNNYEIPSVYYVKHCSNCNGNTTDEKKIESYSFPHLFI